jgi:hypothetical protein
MYPVSSSVIARVKQDEKTGSHFHGESVFLLLMVANGYYWIQKKWKVDASRSHRAKILKTCSNCGFIYDEAMGFLDACVQTTAKQLIYCRAISSRRSSG